MVVRVLNVAEKNDAAKSAFVSAYCSHRRAPVLLYIAAIASLLSGGGRCPFRNGRSPYNKIYTFAYTLNGRAVNMEMTSVSGGLL